MPMYTRPCARPYMDIRPKVQGNKALFFAVLALSMYVHNRLRGRPTGARPSVHLSVRPSTIRTPVRTRVRAPSHATLCYAVLAMLCYAMLCYARLGYAMLCYAVLRYAMLCYAMLCYAMLC